MNEFKIGDVVVLKSSPEEPKMTVREFLIGENVLCTYYNSKEQMFVTPTFKIEMLKLLDEEFPIIGSIDI